MSRIFVFFLSIVVVFSMAISQVTAQTTMQRKQMEEDGELPEEEEADDDSENNSRTTSRRTTSSSNSSDDDDSKSADDYVNSETTWVHIPGVRLDFGWTFHDNGETSDSWAIGPGYMYAWEWDLKIVRSGSLLRIGAGPDLMFVSQSGDGFKGINTLLMGRISGIGPSGGLTLEAGAGGAVGSGGLRPVAKFGLFAAGRHFELGYFYQMTIGSRVDWMTAHHLAFRLNFPMFRH